MLGTCITPTWPRHPVAAVQQVQVIANLAPGRFRFGVGPSHSGGMQTVFGADFKAPLTNVREYVHVVKSLLETGEVDFDGKQYHAHARIAGPVPDVPVMSAALRQRSFRVLRSGGRRGHQLGVPGSVLAGRGYPRHRGWSAERRPGRASPDNPRPGVRPR